MSPEILDDPKVETRAGENPHGAEVRSDGTVRFRLWAPVIDRVQLELVGTPSLLPMIPSPGGWHELITARAAEGSRYRFVLPDGFRVPDPASRYQPEDVHAPSEVVDPSRWTWSDAGWSGRPWEEAVLYELHIGAFTPEGTFRAAIGKLDHLAALGVTAIALMPIGDFPGGRNWGYDGVLPYAPDSAYGRPEDLKALVEAAHARGVMVLLDAVYNHFGPVGNYLSLYAPQFFTQRHATPWGAAINFDGEGCRAVRDFVVQNAIYWVKYFHMDGLRLDAVHAIRDHSPRHILQELSERVRAAAGHRRVHLILENEGNQARWLDRDKPVRPGICTAQWNDDAHHVLHTAVTGESQGYYAQYRGDTVKFGRALAEGFARGDSSVQLPPTAFVAFLQNHDQVGNRAFGDRIAATAGSDALRAASAVYLLLPQIPMLFMGEEWHASQPFPFFCDFDPEFGEAVRRGRREGFSAFAEFRDPEQRERIPDPQAEKTFASAKLRWEDLADAPHRQWLDWYRRILARRRESILPLLDGIRRAGEFQVLGEGAVLVRWKTEASQDLVLAANLSGIPVSGFPAASSSLIWQEGLTHDHGRTLQAWTVRWSVDDPV